MDLVQAIQEALACREAPPPNEATTCDWVILPILYAVGYHKFDIISRNTDSAGKIPDYTLLAQLPEHRWYLEAKPWQEGLNDEDANQAVNYANQNGRRWVVLANGREWHLYDNRIQGSCAQKMVAAMTIEDHVNAVRFLRAIGKESVCSDSISAFVAEEQERRKVEAQRARLSDVVKNELTHESSGLILAMVAELRKREGLNEVQAADVVDHFVTQATEAKTEDETETTEPIERVVAPGDVLEFRADNPPDVTHTRLTSASIGECSANDWNALLGAAIRLAWEKDKQGNLSWVGVHIRRGRHTTSGFHPVPGTDLSFQNVQATRAWHAAVRVAQRLRVPITAEFVWHGNEKAAYPGRQGRMHWTP